MCLHDRFYLLIKVLNRHDLWHPWLYDRCREVEEHPDGYLDIWAREHGKSSLITFAGIIQEILKDPNITVGIFSHTKHYSRKFLAQIKRELEANGKLQALFPDILWDNPERDAPSWSLDQGITVRRKGNTKEATVEAHGLVDGMPTGAHFLLRVYDDVVTRESVATPEQIQKTTECWELSDNLGMEGGRCWHIGTRYSYADTYADIMKRGAAIPRVYPATDDGTVTGEAVLMKADELARRLLVQGEATYSCQMLCNPLAGNQRMFDQADLEIYEVRPETLQVYLCIDPARSIKKDSDHTAMAVLGIDYAGNKYLLDGFDHRMDLQERWTRMRDLRRKWLRETGVQSVNVGYERFGAIADLDYFKERMRVEREAFDIAELEWPREGPGSKIDRVQRLGPDLRSHRFYVPYETDPERLTTVQRRIDADGYGYRIARKIRRMDENGKAYDLTERLRQQIHFFPFIERKDLIDAVSRIFDMEPSPPVYVDREQLEPEFT